MIKVLLVIAAAILSAALHAQVEFDCTFKYRIQSYTDIRICSYEQINASDIYFIQNVVKDAPEAYHKYLSARSKLHNLEYRSIARIDVALISRDVMNDGTLPFGFNRNKDVVGRYYPGEHRVYITLDSLKNGETVLVHEMVHLMNYGYRIHDRDTDEKLAYAFEEFWVSR